ncbi:MAG: hypothetical protein FJX75_20655 [Armatimonadetes bacterium]|nr:hypothetical protein [Armatimonadota bacterium]
MSELSPILLLMAPDEDHRFDLYLEEILLTEGYVSFDRAIGDADLRRYPLVIISAGAIKYLTGEIFYAYLQQGGRAIFLKPPVEWCELLGFARPGETYAVARNAYVRVREEHPWLTGFPACDLQCPGEGHVWPAKDCEPLAFVAGQAGQPSAFPAVARNRIGEGEVVAFLYDLAECIVLFHQGRIEHASTGPDPDANRDGKFTPDDLLEGMRDFSLRHVPQADVHQDLLVRVIRGLTADRLPLPRLWHFPRSAPAVLFVNGDGDSMNREELALTASICAECDARFTFYLMQEQIEDFPPEIVARAREQGHAFGPHPWVSLRPSVAEWEREVKRIVERMGSKYGFAPSSVRSHSCVFPGWDDTPKLFAEVGLRLDTNFISGYRYQSGYANGSGLPVRFIDRRGEMIDCFEQCTIHGDDVMASAKSLLPPLSEDECIALSLEVMQASATRYHGVFQPYFHPIYLSGRGGIPTQRWLRTVLSTAREAGLPSVNAEEWLDFNDARRAARIAGLEWDAESGDLQFEVSSPMAVAGLTVLLPPCGGLAPTAATVAGETREVREVPHEGLGWRTLELDLRAGETVGVRVGYGR